MIGRSATAGVAVGAGRGVERFGWRFSAGDRVMESQNDYEREVFNGDLGTVARIDEEEGAVVVDFDGREVAYPLGELDTLQPTYATTIHIQDKGHRARPVRRVGHHADGGGGDRPDGGSP